MLIQTRLKLYLLTKSFVLSINILYLHIINKSEINIYKSKNVVEKLAITKKKTIFAGKRKKRRIYYF